MVYNGTMLRHCISEIERSNADLESAQDEDTILQASRRIERAGRDAILSSSRYLHAPTTRDEVLTIHHDLAYSEVLLRVCSNHEALRGRYRSLLLNFSRNARERANDIWEWQSEAA